MELEPLGYRGHMGKIRRGHKEKSREQKLIYENKAMKREIASLRKQLARVDLDRYHHVKDIIERSYQLEDESEGRGILEKLRSEWACRECNDGYLEICLYNRPDATFYYRKCVNCSHRTDSQRWNPKIPGIIKVTEEE
jgi:hypothetical protein